ncbi:MAG: RsmB/NOP family class I SAM-dependent RNA methyltransferase, partial [Alphaproteobacteria bacterium]
MTPGARIAAAIEVLTDIGTRHRPVSNALRDWGVSHRFAGSGDRAAIGNIVYDALRHRRSIGFAMGDETSRLLALGVSGRIWGHSADEIADLLRGPHAPAALSSDERAALEADDRAGVSDAVRADIPDWAADPLARSLGKNWVAEMQAMAARPPLDIRVNRLKADRAKVARSVSKWTLAETPFSPDGLRAPPTQRAGRHPNLQAEPAFQKGWFEVQDEGSQIAALMVGGVAGEQVLDLCAGGGGKTLALAASMANKGQVHAADSNLHRLAPIFDRLRRAGTRNVQVHSVGDDLSGLKDKMDRVLVDAPCSGSGTWRRHPDAKWRLSERALHAREAEQAAVIREAADYVRPGGLLIYVTCSLLPSENEEQVAQFLCDRPEFSALAPGEAVGLAELDSGAQASLLDAVLQTPNGILLTPLRTNTDGFYVA